MTRSGVLVLIAVVLAVFGLWRALNGVLLLGAGGAPLLLLLFVAQGVLALVSAWGVARALAWAPAILLLLAAVIVASLLFEAFVLGIRPWLYALFLGALAVVGALGIIALLRDRTRVQ